MAIPQGPNQRWSLDFVTGSLVRGRRFRGLCIIDDVTRECLDAIVGTSISGHRVPRDLDRIAELRERRLRSFGPTLEPMAARPSSLRL
jgi:putative transposase